MWESWREFAEFLNESIRECHGGTSSLKFKLPDGATKLGEASESAIRTRHISGIQVAGLPRGRRPSGQGQGACRWEWLL